MDDQTLLELAALTLQSRDDHGTHFLAEELRIPIAQVYAGDAALTHHQREKLRYLFTDYEWMLAQKIALLPASPDATVAWRFQAAKAKIAQAWLYDPAVKTRLDQTALEDGATIANLRIQLDYGDHGLTDILNFEVPKSELKQLQTKQLTLLEWAEQQLPAPQAESKEG